MSSSHLPYTPRLVASASTRRTRSMSIVIATSSSPLESGHSELVEDVDDAIDAPGQLNRHRTLSPIHHEAVEVDHAFFNPDLETVAGQPQSVAEESLLHVRPDLRVGAEVRPQEIAPGDHPHQNSVPEDRRPLHPVALEHPRRPGDGVVLRQRGDRSGHHVGRGPDQMQRRSLTGGLEVALRHDAEHVAHVVHHGHQADAIADQERGYLLERLLRADRDHPRAHHVSYVHRVHLSARCGPGYGGPRRPPRAEGPLAEGTNGPNVSTREGGGSNPPPSPPERRATSGPGTSGPARCSPTAGPGQGTGPRRRRRSRPGRSRTPRGRPGTGCAPARWRSPCRRSPST